MSILNNTTILKLLIVDWFWLSHIIFQKFICYWYDDPVTKTNGDFDCVIRRDKQYDFYECKYFDRPMTLEECCQEKEQLDNIKGITLSGVGFVCTGGFAFEGKNDFELIDEKELYFIEWLQTCA